MTVVGKTREDRREFLRVSTATGTLALLGAAVRLHAGPAFEWEEAEVADLQEKMRSGALTARALTLAYLDRIQALDRQGPTLRSVLETNPDAVAIAEGLDRERREKGPRGPLHGTPVLVKDNLDTADRMTTTAGSLALAGSIPARDSFVVRRLRESGAVIRARPTSANGRTSAPTSRRADGAPGAVSAATPTPSTATPAARARARGRRSPPTSVPWPPAPRPTARSSALRTPTASWGSSPPSAW